MQRSSFTKQLAAELGSGDLAAFLGAGMSMASGGISWTALLSDAAEELGLCIDKETDLVSLAQFYVNYNRSKGSLAQTIYDKLNLRHATPNDNHRLLAKMPIQKYWTTNFDQLIEQALNDEGKSYQAVYRPDQFFIPSGRVNVMVYKMHGDINHPTEVTITRADFERYHATHEPFISALTGDLTTKTLLFLGLSFTDPNLFYVLGRLRARVDDSVRKHYAIIKSVDRADFDSDDDHAYAKLRQKLFSEELKRYSIHVLEVDSYSEISDVLREIYFLYRKQTIFVSGSAHEYGSLGQTGTAELLEFIIQEQFSNNRRIISGYGLGLGDMVVGAAVRKFTSIKSKSLDDSLLVRPFPQQFGSEAERRTTWTAYRKDMISRAGIALFLFGNKLDSVGTVVAAEGVREEFELARAAQLLIVPVGATGSVAQEIWQTVDSEFDSFYPQASPTLRVAFDQLNEPGTAAEIAQRVGVFIGLLFARS